MDIYNYELDFESLIYKIKKLYEKKHFENVLLQFPDGLKSYAEKIYLKLEESFKDLNFFIFFGTNYGACDIPFHLEKLGIDLVIQFGHTKFLKTEGW